MKQPQSERIVRDEKRMLLSVSTLLCNLILSMSVFPEIVRFLNDYSIKAKM